MSHTRAASGQRVGERGSPPGRRGNAYVLRGVAGIFQRGGHTVSSEGTRQIVMAFSPPVVGCLLQA